MTNLSYLNDLLMNSLKLAEIENNAQDYEKYAKDFKPSQAKEVKRLNIELKALQKEIRSATNNSFGNTLEIATNKYHEKKTRLSKLTDFKVK